VTEERLRQQDPEFVRSTFAGIAGRYDLANHVLSGGIDFLWRAKAARLVAERSPRQILDVATGSGDLAVALAKACPQASVTGVDFCLPMLEIAKTKGVSFLCQGDALNLPFATDTFDALTVSFGLRNMASWEKALQEMARVLRPGGFLLVMDFSLPTIPPLRSGYRLYLHHVLPKIAGLLTGKPEAYDYLGESIEKFPRGQAMLDLVLGCGFENVQSRPLALGIAAITTATKRTNP
jgi:demethylmenaquinone methyltransferase/2-methoxy-6-polyprenyl-1,4-benzoquinol methylase